MPDPVPVRDARRADAAAIGEVHGSAWAVAYPHLFEEAALRAAVAERRTRWLHRWPPTAPDGPWLPSSGRPPVLWTFAGAHRARRFYEREGWTTTGARRAGDGHAVEEVQYALTCPPR